MTDTEMRRREAICKVAGVSEIDDASDGFHTFRQLYYQRMMLFAAIVRQNKDKAWKSFRHEDGEPCFGGGWFIVGVDTPEGSYTYHYEDIYFGFFDCEELERGKHWDGHTEKDVTRLLSLPTIQPDTTTHDSIPVETGKNDEDRISGDCISRQQAIDAIGEKSDEIYKTKQKGATYPHDDFFQGMAYAENIVEQLPSAQPEIIRCKDCAYCDSDVVDAPYGMTKKIFWCDRLYAGANENLIIEPDDSCSWAERREDETD